MKIYLPYKGKVARHDQTPSQTVLAIRHHRVTVDVGLGLLPETHATISSLISKGTDRPSMTFAVVTPEVVSTTHVLISDPATEVLNEIISAFEDER